MSYCKRYGCVVQHIYQRQLLAEKLPGAWLAARNHPGRSNGAPEIEVPASLFV